MSLAGIVTGIFFFFSLIMCSISGRKQWLAILIWCLISTSVLIFTREGSLVNGLVLLICFVMSLQITYSLWGVNIWCTQNRKKRIPVYYFIYVVNLIFLIYCFYECLLLMKFGGFLNFGKIILVFFSMIFALASAFIMQNITISALEIYFSKPEKFPIIECSPVMKKSGKRKESIKKLTFQGIQNGITYIFYMTEKAYLMFKPRKSIILDIRRGFFGGIYVKENIYKDDSKRRIRRVNRFLLRKSLFSVLAVLLLILLFIRIETGMGFEEIFTLLGRGVGIGIR